MPKSGSTIKVVLCEPKVMPREYELENELAPMQQLIGGYLEVAALKGILGGKYAVVCNEEGLLEGLPTNLEENLLGISGTFFVCGVRGSEFCGLNDSQVVDVLATLGVGTLH
jgi:hypothetical protein